MPRCLFCALVLLAAVALGGCDTDNPSTPLEELEGTYVFTELRFDPTAQAIADADVLARLVPSSTDVEIFGSGRTLVRFKLQDRPSDLADVNASASRSTVQFTAATEDDAARLMQILLPGSFTLSRGADDARLSGEIGTRVNLQAFDPEQYAGLIDQPGTLHITLDREDDER